MAILELDQTQETSASEYRRGVFRIRYAYARSKDARLANLRGEDYLVFRVEPDWMAFAVCDGVGGSFFGGLAAQIVGERLLVWLARPETHQMLETNSSEKTVLQALESFLNQQIVPASQLVDQKDVGQLPNQFIRNAYQQKREKHGSQSNFVCGLIDARACRAWLFALGDASLRLWRGGKELQLNLPRESEQSWSSRHGVTGVLQFRSIPFDAAHTLLAYSDGLNLVEQDLVPGFPSNMWDTYIAKLGDNPKSDDISILEIQILPDQSLSTDDLVPVVRGGAIESRRVPISEPMPLPAPLPKKPIWGWRLGLVFFIIGALIGLISGYELRDTVNLWSYTPTMTATIRPSRTPRPSITWTPTPTVSPTFDVFETEIETSIPYATLLPISSPTSTDTPDEMLPPTIYLTSTPSP